MTMRSHINALLEAEQTANPEAMPIGCTLYSFRPGEPIVFSERQLRNVARGPGDYGYTAQILNGKRWEKGQIGELGFSSDVDSPSLYQGRYEGGIWYRTEEKESRVAAMKAKLREALETDRAKIATSLASIS